MGTSAVSGLALTELLAAGVAVRTRVRGGSMRPLFRSGTELEVVPLATHAAASLAPGEVVLVRDGVLHFVHRVVANTPAGITTRGDDCAHREGPVAATEVLGRVERVRILGRQVALASPLGRALSLFSVAVGRARAALRRRFVA